MSQVPAEATICVGHHRHESEHPRRASQGYLCLGCYLGLEQALAEFPARYGELGRALASASGHGQHVTGTPERQLPINVAISDHRTHMHGLLLSWARLSAEEAEVGTPGHLSVESLSAWLLARLAWVVDQPWVDEFASEMTQASRRARSLLQPSGRRRIPIARCPDCDGRLTALLGPADDLLPATIDCDVDPEHVWTADRWQALGKRLGRQYDTQGMEALAKTLGYLT